VLRISTQALNSDSTDLILTKKTVKGMGFLGTVTLVLCKYQQVGLPRVAMWYSRSMLINGNQPTRAPGTQSKTGWITRPIGI